jgi:hypothetical protein
MTPAPDGNGYLPPVTTPTGDDEEDTENNDDEKDDEKDDGGTKNTSYDTIKSKLKDQKNIYLQSYKCKRSKTCLGAWKVFGSTGNLKIRISDMAKLPAAGSALNFIDGKGYILTKDILDIRPGKNGASQDTSKYRTWKVERGDNNTVHFKSSDGKYLSIGDGCALSRLYLTSKKATHNKWTASVTQLPNC